MIALLTISCSSTKEEYGFTIDDLMVFPELKQAYFIEQPGEYGHSTHKNPDFYDLELQGKTARLNNGAVF